MHVAARLLGWTAEGLSLATAAVVLLQQPGNPVAPGSPQALASGQNDTLTWMFRGLLGVSLALNAFFLKKVSDSVGRCTDSANDHDKRIAILERSYEIWLNVEREERGGVERRQRIRRADDRQQASEDE